MGAFEAILGLGALLGVGYYVIQIASKSPLSNPLAVPPLPTPSVVPPSPSPSPPVSNKPKSSNGSKKQPTPEPEADIPKEPEILTPTNSEMTSPNVAGTAFTFNVVGDVDETPATATNLCGTSPSLAIFVGDFAYHNNAQKWWTGSMKACNGKNVIGSLGNHDNGGTGFIDLWPLNGRKWEFIKKLGNIAIIAVNTGACKDTSCNNPSSVESLLQQAQNDPSVKFIVCHHHKTIFTTGVTPDAVPAYHTMYKKYPKIKMVFGGHNHYYARYIPLDGIQYITVGTGGHDLSDSNGSPGPSSKSIGVAKCRVSSDGGITCQFVSNSGKVLDNWGLTAAGKHTGTGGIKPSKGPTVAQSGLAITQAYYSSYLSQRQTDPYEEDRKEERDEYFNKLLQRRYDILNPRRQFNNTIYHYSKYARY